MKDYFLIAKVTSLFGRNGFVKIELFSNFSEYLNELDKVFIDFWGDKKVFYVEEVKHVGNTFALKFKNFNDERDAGVFIGRDLFVAKDDFVNLPVNTFSFNDLIGSKVFQGSAGIGVITDVFTTPANDVIVIKKDNKEFLLPLVLEFIEEFDPEKKILILKKEIAYDDED
ncbi:MAG: 16S rRNA processing protein RimM [Bacteroidetes bacterium]|nr:16S rRNA processing protein RimM [Bacteroidota bacterium]